MLATHSVGALATGSTRVMYSWYYNITYNMADFFSVSRDGEKERDSIILLRKDVCMSVNKILLMVDKLFSACE